MALIKMLRGALRGHFGATAITLQSSTSAARVAHKPIAPPGGVDPPTGARCDACSPHCLMDGVTARWIAVWCPSGGLRASRVLLDDASHSPCVAPPLLPAPPTMLYRVRMASGVVESFPADRFVRNPAFAELVVFLVGSRLPIGWIGTTRD